MCGDFPAREAGTALCGSCIQYALRGFLAHRVSQIGHASGHSFFSDRGTHAPGHTVGQLPAILAESLSSEIRRVLRAHWRVDLVKQQVDDYARHTNIKPKWKSPSRDAAVFVKLFEPGAAQRNEDQRYDHDRQDCVRDQQGKVNRTDPALPLKYDVPHAEMINQVGSQKNGRYAKGGNHEVLVHISLSRPDRGVAPGQQNGADSVQRGV